MDKYILTASLIILFCSLCIFIYDRITVKKTMNGLSDMLDRAISGNFDQNTFDETMYSSLEAKLAKFLAQSSLSSDKIKSERDKIKELIADISHQTKTPIANILLYAQLVSETELPDECRQYVNQLVTQSEKLNFLINSLVNLSRLETGIISVSPKKDYISRLLGAVMENILPKAKAKDIEIVLPETDCEAVFDIKWTAEAINNIADNAVKYTPSGGKIEFSIIPYDMFCRIDISDNGIGIAKEEYSKIFGRFYRSANVSDEDGVGIGLFLAREIISSGKGYIKVSSEPGKGSTFSVFLPK